MLTSYRRFIAVAAACWTAAGCGQGSTSLTDVQVTVAPSTAAVGCDGTLQFSAYLKGAFDETVLWSVQEVGGGSIDASGLYTAPSVPGTYHVIAMSKEEPAAKASAEVLVKGAAPAAIAVAITPKTAAVQTTATRQFSASVTGAADTAVIWSLQEPGGGSISATGLYTAPGAAGTYHVVAASAADPSRRDTATVTVTTTPPPIAVTVAPKAASVQTGAAQQFSATVSGTDDDGVTWTVVEGARGGSVDASGRYTAPGTAGTFHVRARSDADGTKSDTATVTVTAAPPQVAVSISPRSSWVQLGASIQLTATVTGSTNPAVSWSVEEAGGGSVGADGLYTAPQTAGTYHVVATSEADPTKSDRAAVSVSAVCTDACPAANAGVVWECKKRFQLGANFAWNNWATDFGGGSAGVAADSAFVDAGLRELKASGVSVVRWWMWPRFLASGISWGSDGAPSGIGGTMVADVQKALELAEKNDVYLMLTPFSFDNFKSAGQAGDSSRALGPIVTDAARRQKLLSNLIAPVARAVEASPYKKRMIAWDMINEPEWATSGESLYDDSWFEPNVDGPISHTQMETFLEEMAAVLRANSGALVSVGGACIKWGKAWTGLELDFYQLHYYDWMYQWFPYMTDTPQSIGLTDKPVVMGEFPNTGLEAAGGKPARTVEQFVSDLWSVGYAGALSWQYVNDDWSTAAPGIKAFHDQHACEAAY